MVLTRSMDNLNLIDNEPNNLQSNALNTNAAPISIQNGSSSISSGLNHQIENLPVANKYF